jgi:ketosteroid isomerase-like protein
MSQENVEIVQEAVRAFQARDVEAWVNCFHPDAEVLWPRNLLEGGSYRGHEGVRRAIADSFETWEDIRLDQVDIRSIDDCVVLLSRNTIVGKGQAPAVEYQGAYLIKIREGKCIHFRPYQSHREALEAAGLSEQDVHIDS